MSKIKMEACCGSVGDVIIANALGFDSIELNSSLENGGMTPSVGSLIKAKEITKTPIYTMVRARPQGFNYIEAEFEAMLIDAKNLIDNGADGIVFGFINDDGTINIKRTKQMVKVIGDKKKIFHKAIDFSPNIEDAVKILIDLGIDTILTGGGIKPITENIEILKKLEATYGDQITILIGGGITDQNVYDILSNSNIKNVHFTGKTNILDKSTYNQIDNADVIDHSYIGISRENMQKIIEEVERVGQ